MDLNSLKKLIKLTAEKDIQDCLESAADTVSKASFLITHNRSAFSDSQFVSYIDCLRSVKKNLRSIKHAIQESKPVKEYYERSCESICYEGEAGDTPKGSAHKESR